MLPHGDTRRPISWPAFACQYSGAHVHLGLATGLEDAALRRAMPSNVLASYPARRIPVSERTSAGGSVDLRLYAVRDSACCAVTIIDSRSGVDGFWRVKLTFSPPPAARSESPQESPPPNG